jgi:4-hydroxybenzoate polyprenyltransferase
MNKKLHGAVHTISLIGDAIIFRHTLFSLPFALSAILLESAGHYSFKKIILIIFAVIAGRSCANALNRIIDADIDSKNPRTANRHLPQRILSKKVLLIFSLIMAIILVLTAALLEPLCVVLLPIAAVLIGGYSFSKRFTWLCHFWLGLACSCSVMGSFIALSGRFELRYFIFAAVHACWVAGFDILYALQDIAFDRQEHLYSIPACFGAGAARFIAIFLHLITITGIFLLPFLWEISWLYTITAIIAAVLIAAEHIVALGNSERHIRIASYSINEIVPLLILSGVVLGVFF